MEKKLLLLIAISAGATSLITVQETKAAQKTAKSKYDKAFEKIVKLRTDALNQIQSIINKTHLSNSDVDKLQKSLQKLITPEAKFESPQFDNPQATTIYKIVTDTFHKIQTTPNLMPGEGPGQALPFIHNVITELNIPKMGSNK